MCIARKHWLYVGLLSAVCWLAWQGSGYEGAAAEQASPPHGSVIAVVDGKQIGEQELANRARPELLKLESQVYEVKRRAVDEIISEYLLQQAAKARGLTPDELLRQDVEPTVEKVTPKEVAEFYAANQRRINKPLEEMRGQILQYLQESKRNQAKRAYLRELRKTAHVTVYLQPPTVDVSVEEAPVKGSQDAPITIVEFSDFQCPYCKQVLPVLTQVLEQYAGRVKLAFRDFPLATIHPHASRAAEAAHCAEEQGKYWEYHDLLFANQQAIPDGKFGEYAQTLGLEPTAFQACLDSNKYKAKVERGYADGMKAGVTGTPAFFINGRPLSGAQPLESFQAVIDEELERLGLQARR